MVKKTSEINLLDQVAASLATPELSERDFSGFKVDSAVIDKMQEGALSMLEEVPATTLAEVRANVQANAAEMFAPAPTQHVVEKTDSTQVAIWKVLSDGEAYTATELAILLDHFAKYKIYNALATMTKTIVVQSKVKGQRESTYQLVPGSPMPETRPTKKTKEAAPAVETKPSEKEETPMSKSTPTPEVKAAPLLQVTVQIKGQPVSLEYLYQLRRQLDALNVTSLAETLKQQCPDIGLNISMLGMAFTLEEVAELRAQMPNGVKN